MYLVVTDSLKTATVEAQNGLHKDLQAVEYDVRTSARNCRLTSGQGKVYFILLYLHKSLYI